MDFKEATTLVNEIRGKCKRTKGEILMSNKEELWNEAKKKCKKLNAEDIKMAKAMGLNPKSLIKNIPSKNEQWKAPVKVWIHEMYEKRNKNRG